MIEVREITRKVPICARSVINASVIPSAKYSCDASPVRFSKGSTASERMTGAGLGLKMLTIGLPPAHPTATAANTVAAIPDHSHRGPSLEGVLETDASPVPSATVASDEAGAPLSGAMKRYPRPAGQGFDIARRVCGVVEGSTQPLDR